MEQFLNIQDYIKSVTQISAPAPAQAPAPVPAPAPAPVIDEESILRKQYATLLKKENTKLEKTISKKQSDIRVYDRINFYYSQDEVMFVYIQKLLTSLYIVIYFFFMYFLYSNQEIYSRPMSILYLVIFLLLPFTFYVISKFVYNLFLTILQMFNNGNIAYLYSKSPSK